jgi:hypothetical protein
MTITQANLDVCQQALYLLRQDVGLPTLTDAPNDTSLEWAKCRLAFDTAIAEVWNAHDWLDSWGITSQSNSSVDCTEWTAELKTTLSHCVARELAIPLAGRMEDLKVWDTLYRQKLVDARVAALEQERKRVTASPAKDVLDLILPRITADLKPLPRSIATITRRVETFEAPARQAVLAAHAWNFARVEAAVGSAPFPIGAEPYRFAGTMPGNCARLVAVHTAGGRPTEWKVYGSTLVAMEPITSVIYVKDVKDTSKWSPLVKKAYMLRLAADTAQTEAPEVQAVLEERYERALGEAKVVDARESFTPSEQAGVNHYVEAMRGRVPPSRTAPHLPRYAFHGLV